MPKVEFEGEEMVCESGERLRDVIKAHGMTPHNGQARWFNCKGFGSCGTCAVRVVQGDVGEKSAMERWRLDFPPHDAASGLRLACQVRVMEDLVVVKHTGFWGQNTADVRKNDQSE